MKQKPIIDILVNVDSYLIERKFILTELPTLGKYHSIVFLLLY